ncbi:MAG TPA: hypothetical protein VJR23_07445 [Candidatus Acidoferrales bacterium]|nr:hypothetical protein [Candidatus Acidoferrales bacterium]
MRADRLKILAGITIGLLACFAASATSLARMSVVQMAHASAIIVRAKCLSSEVRREEGEIWTFTAFQVEETWKGEARARITVRLLGGRLGEITSHVSGVPQFRAGEDVVLFLERAPRGNYSVVSWERGTFRIRDGSRAAEFTVTQDTAATPVFNPSTRQFEVVGVRRMPLREFRAQVKAATGEPSGSGE